MEHLPKTACMQKKRGVCGRCHQMISFQGKACIFLASTSCLVPFKSVKSENRCVQQILCVSLSNPIPILMLFLALRSVGRKTRRTTSRQCACAPTLSEMGVLTRSWSERAILPTESTRRLFYSQLLTINRQLFRHAFATNSSIQM